MTWQEELRRLDEDFSSGNITADEYRVRRDQVLSSAVAPQADAGQPESAQQGQRSAEETQIVPPVSYESANPDATQVVRSSDVGPPTPMYHPGGEPPPEFPQEWQQGPPSGGFPQQGPPSGGFAQQGPPSGGFEQQSPPAGGYGAPSPPYGFPAQPQQQWGGQIEDQGLLWGGQELPAAAPPTDDWVTQGPEDESDSQSGAGKIIAGVVAVLLVAGAAFGAWWFWLRGDDEPQAQPPGGTSQTQAPTQEPPTTAPTTTTQPLPQPPAAKDRVAKNSANLVDAPGKKRGGGKFTLKDLKDNQYLPTDVVTALKEARMSEGLLLATKDGSVNIGLYSVQVKDESKTVDVAKAYAEVQDNGGVPMDRDLSMQGVPAFTNSNSAKEAVFRAVYIVHDRVVIVETFGKDRDATQSQFDSILSEQVNHAPPTDLNWYG